MIDLLHTQKNLVISLHTMPRTIEKFTSQHKFQKNSTSNVGKINVTRKCPAFNHVHFYGFDKHLLCTTEIEPLYPPIPGYLLCYDFSKAPSFIRQSR